MRGNEDDVGLARTLATARFPIPMRGNEVLNFDRIDGSTNKFPIPMRGNELVEDVPTTRAADAFPIPMRGNERDEQLEKRAIVTCFQSP